MRHLAAYKESQPWLTVGNVLDPSTATSVKATSAQGMVLTPSGQRRPIEEEGSDVMQLDEAGFYELRRGDEQCVIRMPPPGAPPDRDKGILRE